MSDEIDVHIGKRMRRRRRLLGLTQQAVAGVCGVRFQQIQKYECGANRVSASRLWLLSQALDVPVGYFFDGLEDTAAGGQAAAQPKPDLSRQGGQERPRGAMPSLSKPSIRGITVA